MNEKIKIAGEIDTKVYKLFQESRDFIGTAYNKGCCRRKYISWRGTFIISNSC